MLGAFGRQDQRIELYVDGDKREWQAKAVWSHPMKGTMTRRQEAMFEKFGEKNGKWFLEGVELGE